MDQDNRIITVGLTGAWDMLCEVDGIDWGQHRTVDSSTRIPAGKALNINKALAYLGRKSVFTGLWGQNDYAPLCEHLKSFEPFLDNQVTAVAGATRTNITVEDTAAHRHLHLRFSDELCSNANLSNVTDRLNQILCEGDLCVFAGSLPPEPLWDSVIHMVNVCVDRGGQIVLDSNGPGCARLIDSARISVISPNLLELSQLLDRHISDDPIEIRNACKPLLEKVDVILISRGKLGAMAVTKEQSSVCRLRSTQRPVFSEVGCGDHFLAGFISFFSRGQSLQNALAAGVKLATFHAWGLTKSLSAAEIDETVDVQVNPLT